MSNPTRIPFMINTVLIAAIWGFAISVYPGLPERIPVHFGISGAPDRWVEASFGAWFSLPIMALLITGLLFAGSLVPLMGVKNPGIVSMPSKYKERFMTLSPEERKHVMDSVRALILWMVVPSNALQTWVLTEMHAVATGQRQTGRFAIATALLLGATAVIVIVGLWRVFGALGSMGSGKAGGGSDR